MAGRPEPGGDQKTPRSARGAQARARLKRAARKVMERVGYHDLRVADVTAEAGVATGLFYHYFDDLKSLTLEVLRDFVAESQNIERIEKDVARGDWYGRMLAYNRLVVDSYDRHPGVMRCLLQMADQDVEFAALLRSTFVEQLNWLVRVMPRLFPGVEFEAHQALLVAYGLGGGAELLLRHYYIDQDKDLRARRMTAEQLAELLAFLFYRGLFLENPPAERLSYTRNLLGMVRTDKASAAT